jgi:hypothetical protein
VKLSRRLVVFVFFLLIILFVGMLFWPFVQNEVIAPISLAVWVLLRIFVLSVDQQYYWGAIIFVAAFFLYRHFLSSDQPTNQSEDFQGSNATMRDIEYWKFLFIMTNNDTRDDKALKRELTGLLLSFFATKQFTSADFRLYDALQRGEIPIPEHIHTFLFSEEPEKAESPFKKLVQSIRNAPRKWVRRWTGQETADRYRMINEVLGFLETSLEMKNDNGKFSPN